MMKNTIKQIVIESDKPELYRYLKSGSPSGMTLEPKLPMRTQRDVTIPTTIEFIVNIDIAEIIRNAGLIYLLTKIKRTGGKTKLTVNGKQITVNDSNAIELIAKEIENEKD